MAKKGTSLFENGLIWFGAALSIAEILTGTAFASLGMLRGGLAIIIGHVIGCVLLFTAGLIGARTGKSSMETVKMSFGERGGKLFALLNVLQLLGWTAIMIYDGALAAEGLIPGDHKLWVMLIGTLICLWILIGIKNLGRLNSLAMTALFILTLLLSVRILGGVTRAPFGEALSFGAAVELSVAMPLSWLPLISDYTREAEKPAAATAVSAAVYGMVSSWMYFIGMAAAIYTGESDIAGILLNAGLGLVGLLIVVFSTVTTTFLDVWSAGVSTESVFTKAKGKWMAVIITALGTVGAMNLPLYDITGFLYFIGSVFAPMIAIQIVDNFILKKTCRESIEWSNLIIWFAGFVLYRVLMRTDFILGNTLPDMLITGGLCLFRNAMERRKAV